MKTKTSVASTLNLCCSGEGQAGPTLMSLVYPIVRANQLLGACPLTLKGDTMLFSWTSKNCIHTIVTLVAMIAYFLCIAAQVIYILMLAPDDPVSGTQSPSKSNGSDIDDELILPRKIVRLVTLSSRIFGTLIPIIGLALVFPNRHSYVKFFDNIESMRQPLGAMMDCSHSVRTSRRTLLIYSCLAIVATGLVFWNSFIHPRSEGFILYFYPGNDPPPKYWVLCGSLFQSYIVLMQYVSCSVIETMVAILAKCLTQTVRNLQGEMDGLFNLDESVDTYYTPMGKNSGSIHHRRSQFRVEDKSDPFVISISPNYWSFSSLPQVNTSTNSTSPGRKSTWVNYMSGQNSASFIKSKSAESPGYPGFKAFMKTDTLSELQVRVDSVKKAISGFHCVIRIQNLINSVLGCIMALNTALHVLLTCFVLFLVIMNFHPEPGHTVIGVSSSRSRAGEVDAELEQEEEEEIYYTRVNFDCLIMLGFMFCVLARLLLVFVNLGNFHHVSSRFCGAVSEKYVQMLLMLPNSMEGDESRSNKGGGGGGGEAEERSNNRKYASLRSDIHVIGAFLNSQIMNPCCFSAGGFFIFSRQSLLATFSIILTYVIFLVQAK